MSVAQAEQLDRIEAKLDALLEALAEESHDEEPLYDLDGLEISGSRDESGAL